MNKKNFFPLVLTMLLLLSACQSRATPTLEPTSTFAPTDTPVVENTPTSLPPTPTEDPNPRYRDPTAPIEARVEDLLARMTLEEKIGQMTLIEKNSIQPWAVTPLTGWR